MSKETFLLSIGNQEEAMHEQELSELHNRVVVEVVTKLLKENTAAGGDSYDLLVIITSIVAGIIRQLAGSSYAEEMLLQAVIEEVGIRLGEMPNKRLN